MAKEEISLLPRQGLEGTPLGRLIDWLLSSGRYIIIFTELIVIGAFLSRFWLDRKNSDLSEEIRQQKAILEATRSFEQEFRLFQTRLNVIARHLKRNYEPLQPLDVITQSLPKGVVVLSYSFTSENQEEANLLALVLSESDLAQFVDNLLARAEVSKVRIGTIEKESKAQGMKIQFTVGFKDLNREKDAASNNRG